MPIVVARLDDVPAGESPIAGMIVGAVTLALVTILMLRGAGIWRLMAFPITIIVGCAVAVALGVYDIKGRSTLRGSVSLSFRLGPGLSLCSTRTSCRFS